MDFTVKLNNIWERDYGSNSDNALRLKNIPFILTPSLVGDSSDVSALPLSVIFKRTFSTSGDIKPQLEGQIWPPPASVMASWAKKVFYIVRWFFFKSEKKPRRIIMLQDTWKWHAIKVSISINKVLAHSTFIHFLPVCDCFPATMAELSICDRSDLAHKAWTIHFLALYRKFANPCSRLYGWKLCVRHRFLPVLEFCFSTERLWDSSIPPLQRGNDSLPNGEPWKLPSGPSCCLGV